MFDVYRFMVPCLLAACCVSAHAATVNVSASGDTGIVSFNFPSGPATFHATYSTDTTLATFKQEAPNDVSYVFSGGPFVASATIGATNFDDFGPVEVGIGDNVLVSAGDFPGLPAGTYDAFSVAAHSPGATLVPSGLISQGTSVLISFFTATTFFDGVDQIPLSAPDGPGTFKFFSGLDIQSGSAVGISVGDLTGASFVATPLPGAVWFILSALATLGLFRRIQTKAIPTRIARP